MVRRSAPTRSRSSGSLTPRPSRSASAEDADLALVTVVVHLDRPPRRVASSAKTADSGGTTLPSMMRLVGRPRLAVVGEVRALDRLELHPEVTVVVLDHVATRRRARHDRARRAWRRRRSRPWSSARDARRRCRGPRRPGRGCPCPDGATRSRPGCARPSRSGSPFARGRSRAHSPARAASRPCSRSTRRRWACRPELRTCWTAKEPMPPDAPQMSTLSPWVTRRAVARHQHAIGGRVAQRVDRRLLPREVRGLGHQLVGLDHADVGEAAEVRLEAPDALVAREHRVVVTRGVLVVDVVAVDGDLVADLPVAHRRSGAQHDARRRRNRRRGSRARGAGPRTTPCPADRGTRRWTAARRCSSTPC